MPIRFALLILLVPLANLVAQETSTEKVDDLVRAEMDRQQIVGAAVGIIVDRQIVHLKGYGLSDRENKVPATRETMFRWASISKPLTAIAALQLAEQGKLDLDADVGRYVPEFPGKGVTITSRQLLCHQGGIVHYRNGKVVVTKRAYEKEHPFADVVVALDRFKDSPLVARPGEKFSYTTHGYILLSAVVERAGKQPFADQVAERIARPLGMETLRPDYQWLDIPDRTIGYRKLLGKVVRSTDTDVSWKLGGGGFISNAEDMAKLAIGLMGDDLLSPKTKRDMFVAQKTSDGERTRYGLGLAVMRDAKGRRRIGHTGSQEKTKTLMWFHPDLGTGVVILCNSEHANPKKLAEPLFDWLFEQEEPRNDHPQ